MSCSQMYYGKKVRWIVVEIYSGKFSDKRIICMCDSLLDAKIIIDALVESKKGRPFEYKAEKVGDGYIPEFDEVNPTDLFSGVMYDYSKYLKGVSCL